MNIMKLGHIHFTAALLGLSIIAVCAQTNSSPLNRIAEGPFKADWKSLQQYQCPEWFRDAKFGIWAHWSAQCVPEQGDWYARYMYEPGNPIYEYHLTNYGHPSKFGFKDIDNLWHAENWNPEKLMSLYKKAGAKYFVALANHCDNFDCFDSSYQPWNSVRVGPHKDIVGGWAKVARAAGLRFGVSVHSSHAWSWLEPAQGADKEGPLAGIPYDGKLTKADGKGQWWEGLDPQDLYAQNHQPGTNFDWYWDAKKGSSIPDQAYCDKYYNRSADLINKYHPDLVYYDDSPIPLWPISNVGLEVSAHYYNSSIKWHGGKNEAVLTGKNLEPDQERCLVHDMERGKMPGIDPIPWQTDSCIGNWHYKRELFDKHEYKKAAEVIPMLTDIVSKNGNLLLNIPVRGDGSIDADEIAFLKEMASWMEVNHEGIFSTRPWAVFGEGPSTMADNGTGVSEGQADVAKSPFTAQDIRFTQSKDGKTLYAFALGWPADSRLVIKSLAANGSLYSGEIGSVHLLGVRGKLKYVRDESGLTVALPEKKPCDYVYAIKIQLKTSAKPKPASTYLLPASELIKQAEQIQYKSTPQENLCLYLLRPPGKAASPLPAIVYFTGGGWVNGTPDGMIANAAWWRDQGIIGIAADYRVKSRHGTTPLECVKDGKSAIRFVREHARELGVDPDRIIAAGGSAGGHVAAATELSGNDETNEDNSVSSKPNALVLHNPALGEGFGADFFSAHPDCSPLVGVGAGWPPTILSCGTLDKTTPYAVAERFVQRMKAAGNVCELITVPNADHSCDWPATNANFLPTMTRMAEFLHTNNSL
jgi:alpha-L-fucosidase